MTEQKLVIDAPADLVQRLADVMRRHEELQKQLAQAEAAHNTDNTEEMPAA